MGPPPTGTPTATGTSGATNSGSTDNGTGTNSDGGNGTGAGSNKKSSSAGPIAGGVVGGIVAIAAILAILFYRRRRKNRSYRPPSGGSGGGHDRPSSWVPFLAGTGGGSRGSRSKDRSFRSSNDDYESQDTSMQTFDATSCTPPGGDLGGAILTHDELGQLALPRMSSATYGSSSTSIPSAASLPPISERNSMASSESHETSEMSFGAAFSSFAEPERERPKPKLKTSPMTPTAIPIQRRQNLEPIATQTEYQLPAGWPSPPTSPPMSPLRSGPRPPPRNRPGSTSLSPPTSPFL